MSLSLFQKIYFCFLNETFWIVKMIFDSKFWARVSSHTAILEVLEVPRKSGADSCGTPLVRFTIEWTISLFNEKIGERMISKRSNPSETQGF